MVLANEDSPVFLSGAFEAIASCCAAQGGRRATQTPFNLILQARP